LSTRETSKGEMYAGESSYITWLTVALQDMECKPCELVHRHFIISLFGQVNPRCFLILSNKFVYIAELDCNIHFLHSFTQTCVFFLHLRPGRVCPPGQLSTRETFKGEMYAWYTNHFPISDHETWAKRPVTIEISHLADLVLTYVVHWSHTLSVFTLVSDSLSLGRTRALTVLCGPIIGFCWYKRSFGKGSYIQCTTVHWNIHNVAVPLCFSTLTS